MSTSDQQEQGPLTRKQLREIRLTGSTPVISSEEAAAAAEAAVPAPPLPRAAEPVATAAPPVPEPVAADQRADAPLTRRQAREQEKVRTASVPVVGADAEEADDSAESADEPASEPVIPAPSPVVAPAAIVSGIPDFSRTDLDDDDVVDDEIAVVPVSASAAADSVGAVPLEAEEAPSDEAQSAHDVEAVLGLDAEDSETAPDDDVLADVDEAVDDTETPGVRPTVNSAFGEGILADAPDPHAPFRPSFDDLLTVGDSTGSQHSAPNALIFTPSPGEGSLSGPVASTGEILVTGSYELPQGMGSQGHALGTTDGKDVDAVLIDGELPPASSPTPIAASSAVSTIKPAGEVIRPPAPEKGNRLMLTLAIVAGGLALALGVALIFAFTTNVL
ncbi:hypothetical protein [Microbacterium sp. Se63.02b]|uniref:hypothetical protein n=1 Tax=Microbacterium sp. Se63.02b TaxID=2709304 RepID=UPI001604F250|nr:hypothetical protein [Microbacterium sp. Se63.02b]QNA92843.1 hypothetical protein G4G29_11560 [Microbacterium sp. Se63.02b]